MQSAIAESEEKRYAELQAIALDCARRGETATLSAMLDAGLPVNLADAGGNSLLMLASYHGHLEATRLLLEHGADVDRRNDRGQTPLGGVAFKGEQEIVAVLLEHGAAIDADNGGGMTPIMFASLFGRSHVMEQLKAHGASLRRRNRLGISAGLMVYLSQFITRLLSRKESQARNSGTGWRSV